MAGKIKVPSELVPSQSNKIMIRSKYVHDDVKGHDQEYINNYLEDKIDSKVIDAGGVTWDEVPTDNSNAAVKSKDIKAALEKTTGYFVLDSNVLENTVNKTVTIANFPKLNVGGSIKIKMLTKNTATNPTLRIGPSTYPAFPLYYNNERASASNSWEANEVISVYFDGTNYQASNAQGGGNAGKKKLVGTRGYYPIVTSGDTESVSGWQDSAGVTSVKTAVQPGDVVSITGVGGGTALLYIIAKDNDEVIEKAKANEHATEKVLVMPDDAAWLYIQNATAQFANPEWYFAKKGTVGADAMPARVAQYTMYDNSQSRLAAGNVQEALDEVANKFITSELYVSKLSQAIPSKSVQYLSTSLGLIARQTYRVVIELSTTATSSMAFYLRSVATSSTPIVGLADVAIGDKTIEVSYTPSTSTNYQYLAWYSNESTSNSFDIYFYIDEEIENVAPAFTAEGTSYDNNNSKLSATNVQEALDEISEEYKLVIDTGYNPLGKGMANAYVASQDWVNVTLDNHSITLTIANKQTSAYTQGPICTILKNGKTYKIEFDYETDFNTQIRIMFSNLTVQNDIVLKSFSGSGHAIITHTMPYDSGGLAFLIPANTSVGETISITNFFVYEDSNVKDVLTEVVKENGEGEKSFSILSNITKPCELAQVGAYGMYINTNTYAWTNNANNTSCYVYKVIGGTSVKMSTNSTTKVQYTFLTNIDAVAGNLVDFADGWGKTLVEMAVDETVTVDVPDDAKYIYMLSSPPTWGAPKRIDGVVGDGINVVDFVGDSLTATGLSRTSPMAYFPSKVREYLGIDGLNIGVSGENAGTILGRCNGIPYKLASNVTIPSDTTNVQIYITNIYGQHLLPLLHRYTSYTVVIDGIEGTLTTTQTNVGAANADYFFQRKVSGTAYNAKAGDDIFVNDFKPTFNPHRAKIIWIGQNGGFDTNSTSRWGGDINNADDRARLIDMIKTYIDVSGCEYYMVLSAPQNTNNDLETDFTKAFGNRYFNVRMYMINHGIDDAIALGYLSASSYPTQQDITDMNNGVVPSSLRTDNVHFTQNGFYTLAYALSIKLKEVWNL